MNDRKDEVSALEEFQVKPWKGSDVDVHIYIYTIYTHRNTDTHEQAV